MWSGSAAPQAEVVGDVLLDLVPTMHKAPDDGGVVPSKPKVIDLCCPVRRERKCRIRPSQSRNGRAPVEDGESGEGVEKRDTGGGGNEGRGRGVAPRTRRGVAPRLIHHGNGESTGGGGIAGRRGWGRDVDAAGQ